VIKSYCSDIFQDILCHALLSLYIFRFEGEIPEMVTKLNVQQQQAVAAIYSNPRQKRAPIVIAGPYGTGKTFTFAQCIKVILDQPDTRVLVCTHSNSAADLYVKDYLHPMVQSGMNHYRPLRVFYKVRWLATVHHSVIEVLEMQFYIIRFGQLLM
jgi:hypothetical protein